MRLECPLRNNTTGVRDEEESNNTSNSFFVVGYFLDEIQIIWKFNQISVWFFVQQNLILIEDDFKTQHLEELNDVDFMIGKCIKSV